MSNSIKETIAKVGLGAKGIIYCLIGALTVYSAFNYSEVVGKQGVIKFLMSKDFGTIYLLLLLIGIICYVLYRLYQSASYSDSDSKKEIVKRVSYVLSAIMYGLFAFSIISVLQGSSGGSSNSNKLGQTAIIIIGIGAALFAIYQIYKGLAEKHHEKINRLDLSSDKKNYLKKLGKVGLVARGVVVGIVSFLLLRSAIIRDNSKLQSTQDAFQQIKMEGGEIVLIVIALGILAYGFYTMTRAAYGQPMKDA